MALALANLAWFFIQRGTEPHERFPAPAPTIPAEKEDIVTLQPSGTLESTVSPPEEANVVTAAPSHEQEPIMRVLPAPSKRPMFDPTKKTEAILEAKPVMMCFEVGPYLNRKQTEPVRRELNVLGARVAYETRANRAAAGYWVYLPPERSAALGRLKVEEIKTRGINDVVLVQKGTPKYAISLGVFKHKDTAERRLEQAKSLGYPATLEKWYSEDPEVWLNVSFPDIVMEKVDWTKFVDPAAGVQYAPMDCPP